MLSQFVVESQLGSWQGLGPTIGGGRERKLAVPLDQMTPDKVKDVLTGRSALHIYAECEYKDQFHESHATSVCMVYVPSTRGWDLCSYQNETN